ncbi:PAS domain-containing protein [Robbsia sp. Bb-Pol-6]|uniref:histidine kinase n=1 Tax=Robbsia betulipollinis TaxID=2981849 RepID=A0ABT3ZRZ3_9BURK|nr:ATP-binding protein [Robbsia betulipollinis]MCY0389247.1 PAS domain-containing protein [Robbsia betulipollinis]
MDTLPAALPPYAQMIEHAPCGLLVTTTRGLIVRANATFSRWLGYEAGEIIAQRRLQDFLTLAGRAFHQTHWAPLLEIQRSVAEVKLDVMHRDGRLVPMLINATRRRYGEGEFDELAVMVVTERHRYESELLLARKHAETALDARLVAQRALEENRDVLSLALRGARMGVWSRDLTTQEITWSRELEELIGLSDGRFQASVAAFYARVHDDDREMVRQAVERALTQRADYTVEFRLLHGDGQWRWMEGRGRALYDADGQALSLHGLFIDISARKQGEALLTQLNRQLSDADRRKDEFLATLAHELRNPLAPMRNVLELLRQKEFSDPQVLWSREVFERQLQHMTHLVDDLLEVSRITQGKLELRKQPVELASVMSAAVETSRPLMLAGAHQLVVQFPNAPIVLDADPTRLSQMLQNLLNNAAKYTPAGGLVTLSAERVGDEAVISVRDSGIGIAQEHLTSIFEMFSQLSPALDRAQGGLGIGLSLVRALTELHGGQVSADSDGDGRGSLFTVRLPVCDVPVPPAAPESGLLPLASRDGRRILIVDDNEDAALSLSMVLESGNQEVRTAFTGLSGLHAAETFRADVVILDIGLPDINGYEVARRIRATGWGKRLLLIALTGWGQEQDKRDAAAAGFDHHFTKPVDFHGLLTVLAAHAGRPAAR